MSSAQPGRASEHRQLGRPTAREVLRRQFLFGLVQPVFAAKQVKHVTDALRHLTHALHTGYKVTVAQFTPPDLAQTVKDLRSLVRQIAPEPVDKKVFYREGEPDQDVTCALSPPSGRFPQD